MRIDNLRFFDKNGGAINLDYNGEYWIGGIDFALISTGLYETVSIHITELVSYNNNTFHSYPFAVSPAVSIEIALLDSVSTISLFEISNSDLLSFATKSLTSKSYTVNGTTNDLVDVAQTFNEPLTINLYTRHDTECVSTNQLEIKADGVRVALIDLYSEIEGVDERLSITLNNLTGEVIDDDMYRIFRDSDINDYGADNVLLNQKRKELILEHNNIYPYLGTYRGIINVLKFFGYYDLKLKEYWYHPTDKKYTFREVILGVNNRPPMPYKKVNKYGLCYCINMVTPNEFDDYGVPITEKCFDYSLDEVLVKLFSLREWLQKNNVGGISTIEHILGEAIYFERYDMNIWNDFTSCLDYGNVIDASYELTPYTDYIDDIRYLDAGDCDAEPDITSLTYLLPIENNIEDCPISHFDPYNMETKYDKYEVDIPNNPIGKRVKLDMVMPKLIWEDASPTWEDMGNMGVNLSWDNLDHPYFYDIEWVISKSDDDAPFYKRTRLPISEGKEYEIDLPVIGYYDIKMVIHGYHNTNEVHAIKKAVVADIKPLSFVAFFNVGGEMSTWDRLQLPWIEVGSSWIDKRLTKSYGAGLDIHERSLKQYRYNDYGGGRPNYGPTNKNWLDINGAWDDYQFTSWDDLDELSIDNFLLELVNVGSDFYLQINGIQYNVPPMYTTQEQVAEYLDSQISELQVLFRPNTDGITTMQITTADPDDNIRYLITANDATISNPTGDSWEDCVYPWIEYDNSWDTMDEFFVGINRVNRWQQDNVYRFNGKGIVPTNVAIVVVVDNGGMRGISADTIIWTLYDDKGVDLWSEQYHSFYYKFTSEGTYGLRVDVIDNNGNTNSHYMNAFFTVDNDLFRKNRYEL